MQNRKDCRKENERKKLSTATKIGIFTIVIALIAIFTIVSMQMDIYVKAIIVLVLVGVIIKLTERVLVDIYNMWDTFDFWRKLRR